MTSWLRTSAGVRIPLGTGGVVIGRSSACTIVVDDPEVSRRHALVLPTGDCCQVILLHTRGDTLVEGGAAFQIGSASFVYEQEVPPPGARWMIRVGGLNYPIHGATVTIGSGEDSDLIIDELPEVAAVVHVVDHLVAIDMLQNDEPVVLAAGRVLLHGIELEIIPTGDREPTTVSEQFPSAVIIEVVPKGVVLRVRVGVTDRAVFLPQARGDLVLALLRPVAPAHAGDFIDDDAILAAMHGRAGGTRQQLNVTIHRARMSLTSAGLVGPLLIQRAPGGGSTRFRIASNATVSQI